MTTEMQTVEPEQRAPMTLFGTDDPAAVVDRASRVATSLAEVIKERRLSSRISGKEHVNVEGWTLLGSMLGVFAEVEWSRPLDNGWEARAVARTLNGNVVGAAEAMCTTGEGRWRSADPYAVRSMAQTRAVSKALRMPLGFIMHLAGYSATPAEEITEDREEARRPAEQPSLREQIVDALADKGLGLDQLERLADEVGVPKGTKATDAHLRQILARIQQPAQDEREPTAGGATSANPATTPEPASQPESEEPPASDPAPPFREDDPDAYRAWYEAQPAAERAKIRAKGLAPEKVPA